MMCEACERGDHRFCGMQTWCECEDGLDGDASAEELEAYHAHIDANTAKRPCSRCGKTVGEQNWDFGETIYCQLCWEHVSFYPDDEE